MFDSVKATRIISFGDLFERVAEREGQRGVFSLLITSQVAADGRGDHPAPNQCQELHPVLVRAGRDPNACVIFHCFCQTSGRTSGTARTQTVWEGSVFTCCATAQALQMFI